jgi:hypothetical protein
MTLREHLLVARMERLSKKKNQRFLDSLSFLPELLYTMFEPGVSQSEQVI